MPAKEGWDEEELDENCDGVRNEGCTCTPGEMTECGKNVGICKPGTQTCDASGAWGTECPGEVKGQAEVCDGKADEDCDGTNDNGCECTNGATDETCVVIVAGITRTVQHHLRWTCGSRSCTKVW